MMRHRPLWLACVGLTGLVVGALPLPPGARAQHDPDPFADARALQGSEALVPPRALAVIPERHTGRRLRVIDELSRIEPQFDDLARGAGMSPARAIQLRTREANIPIFVEKTDATVSTVLQLELGARIEVRGVLLERGGRYLLVASSVRPAPAGTPEPRSGRRAR
ncbi:MAG: hypothetical protein AB7P00_37705 [Sandaracinaceae bacterium]